MGNLQLTKNKLHEGLSETEFYGDLLFWFTRIVGKIVKKKHIIEKQTDQLYHCAIGRLYSVISLFLTASLLSSLNCYI